MITKEEFDKAQYILGKKGKPRPKNKRLPFMGIIECSYCGGMITAYEKFKTIKKTKEIRSYIYHRCTRKKKDKICYEKPITKDDLIKQVEQYFEDINLPEIYLTWGRRVLSEYKDKEETDKNIILKNLENSLKEAENKINNLISLFVSSSNQNRELLRDEEFKSQKNSLMQEKIKASQEIKKQNEQKDEWVELTEKTFKFCIYAKHWFEKGTIEDKNNILKTLGVNWTLEQRKLGLTLAKPFYMAQNTFKLEIPKNARLEPAEMPINTIEKASYEAIYPTLCPGWDLNPHEVALNGF